MPSDSNHRQDGSGLARYRLPDIQRSAADEAIDAKRRRQVVDLAIAEFSAARTLYRCRKP